MNGKLSRALAAGGLLVLGLAVGCSKNVPCQTNPSQIQDARAELEDAQSQVESVSKELQAARSEKSDLEKKLNGLPDKDDLEARLQELKKGSGH